MKQPIERRKYDVIIIGAGPSGCACALALKDAGLKVAILDKQSFPRDKVCGDAIPGRAVKILKDIAPEFALSFKHFPHKYSTKKTQINFNGQVLELNWVSEAYTCTRMEFDNFLYSLVKENTATAIYTNTSPDELHINEQGVSFRDKSKRYTFEAKVLIGADGAHSIAAKQLTNRTLDRNHHVGSVRAYYKNVSNMTADTTEVYLDKKFLPSYLWIFPLPGNIANVGFGMLSSEIQKRKINLKKAFYNFIDQNPQAALKFKNAEMIGELEGFGLPLGSRKVRISGTRFMLVGDAASLIDPISGDGIGNAMLSGRLAAQQVIKCFEQSHFTEDFMQQYDESLSKAIGSELKARFKAQQALSKMPFLMDVVFWVGKIKTVKKLLQKKL